MEEIRTELSPNTSSLIRRLRPLVLGAVSFISLVALTAIAVEGILRRDVDPTVQAINRLQEKHFETYLADVEFLRQAAFLEPMQPAKMVHREKPKIDAGASLNSLVYWIPKTGFGRAKPLVTPGTREFLLRYQTEWIKGRSFFERGKLKADLTLFDQIQTADFWNLEAAPPLQEIAKKGDFILPSALPLPEALDLLSAVKIRLIKGSIDHEPLRALQEVRAFANLLMTTENYQLVSAGLAALEFERRAHREYVERGWLDPAAWTPIDRNSTARAQRAILATMGYMRILTSSEVMNKFIDLVKHEHSVPGLCAAVNEQLPLEFGFRNQITGHWPVERNFSAQYRFLETIATRARELCRLEVFGSLMDNDAFEIINPQAPWPLAHVPYFRSLFALHEWTSLPRRFDGYDRVPIQH